VRWFVEKGFFSVNEKNLVEAVRKCCPQEKNAKKCPHQQVKDYLLKRGMQM
jgi:N-acetylglutamate synthase-like GNAT family acetyltransferase